MARKRPRERVVCWGLSEVLGARTPVLRLQPADSGVGVPGNAGPGPLWQLSQAPGAAGEARAQRGAEAPLQPEQPRPWAQGLFDPGESFPVLSF